MFIIERCCPDFRRYAFIPLLFVFAIPAHGMVYSWSDSAGVSHYTNKEYEIPNRYRAKVKSRYPEPGDGGGSVASQIVQQNPQANVKVLPSAPVPQEKPGVASVKTAPTAIKPVPFTSSPVVGPRNRVRTGRTGPED